MQYLPKLLNQEIRRRKQEERAQDGTVWARRRRVVWRA